MFSLIAGAGVFAADRFIKDKVEKGEIADGRKFIKNAVEIRKSYNSGFAMNKADDKPRLVLVITAAVFGMAFMLYLKTFTKKHKKIKRFGLGLVLGGALSNLFDRFKNDKVTDYAILKGHDKVAFNIGDIAVCLGAAIAAFGEIISDED